MKTLLKILLFLMIQAFSSNALFSQGVSVSYIIPDDGYLSIPVSPFSVRDLRLSFSDYMGVQTGGSLYYFPGLPIDGLPFTSQIPLRGPTAGVLVPLEIYVGAGLGGAQVIASGGVLGMYVFGDRLLMGNWDRDYASDQGWDVANGTLDLENKPGLGWIAGVSVEVPVTRQYSLVLGASYLSLSANNPVEGSFTGGSSTLGIVTNEVIFDDAKTRLSGFELSAGVSF